MKVLNAISLHGTDREVKCPKEGFSSIRMLLKSDNMGFTMTRTTIYPTPHYQEWHYKNHLEACYCVSGHGRLRDQDGNIIEIGPGDMYALDKHDKHGFRAISDRVVLICVFNPPLTGQEVHREDGSYWIGD